MEQETLFIGELVGKTVWITTAGGVGTKEDLMVGDYKGTLLGFDGQFLKLEYETKKFAEGSTILGKEVILISIRYVITAEAYMPSLNH
jgi:hypothetical protein